MVSSIRITYVLMVLLLFVRVVLTVFMIHRGLATNCHQVLCVHM